MPGSRDRGAGPERLSVRTWDVMGTARARTGGWAAPPGHWWGEGGGGGWGKRARARREIPGSNPCPARSQCGHHEVTWPLCARILQCLEVSPGQAEGRKVRMLFFFFLFAVHPVNPEPRTHLLGQDWSPSRARASGGFLSDGSFCVCLFKCVCLCQIW